MEWISVDDRVPVSRSIVLGYSSEFGVEVVQYTTYKGFRWIDPCDVKQWPYDDKDTISHWMPLPEEPRR